jgi:transposase-like protein
MSELRFTEEEIAAALRRAESGVPVPEVCRQVGCSEAIFCVWAMLIGNGLLVEAGQQRSPIGANARRRFRLWIPR